MIQLHRLEGFYWVARAGGYASAARAFPYAITQPAVHQQVKKLEADLGLHLFERVGKNQMALTPAGQRLYSFVKPFYEGLSGVVRSIRAGDYGGELTIHTAALFLRHLMPPWILRLHKLHPDIQIHLEETLRPDIEGLRRGEADLIVDHIPHVPDDIATMPVATLYPFIVMPKGHRFARRKRLPLTAFEQDTFVGYTPGLLAHELQLRVLAESGVHPQRFLTASSAEAILGMVEAGLGYSLVPSIDPNGPRSKGVAVLPLLVPRMEFTVYAAWRKDTPENPLLDAALETAPKL